MQLLLEADCPDMVDGVIDYMKHLHTSGTVTSACVRADAYKNIILTTVEELLSVIAALDIPEVRYL